MPELLPIAGPADHATLFVSDLHGSRAGLDRILHKARLEGWDQYKDMLVSTGDMIDKGDDQHGTLDTFLELLASMQLRLKMLVGNHEVMALEALQHREPLAVGEWMKNGGVDVVAQEARRKNMRLSEPVTDHFPVRIDVDHLPDKTRKYIRNKWFVLTTGHQLETLDMPQAFESVRKEFLEGRYAALFRSMQMIHASVQGVFAVHAGINDFYAEQIEVSDLQAPNRLYESLAEGRLLAILCASEEKHKNRFEPLWMRERDYADGRLLTARTVDILRGKGVRLLIHGHDPQKSGIQQCSRYGEQSTAVPGAPMLTVIDNDTHMAGGRKGGFTLVRADGTVMLWNAVTGTREITRRSDMIRYS